MKVKNVLAEMVETMNKSPSAVNLTIFFQKFGRFML